MGLTTALRTTLLGNRSRNWSAFPTPFWMTTIVVSLDTAGAICSDADGTMLIALFVHTIKSNLTSWSSASPGVFTTFERCTGSARHRGQGKLFVGGLPRAKRRLGWSPYFSERKSSPCQNLNPTSVPEVSRSGERTG